MITDNIYYDNLTSLPNYMKFMTDDCEEVFGKSGCILVIKIKPLRYINDVYGREIGDILLRTIGQCISESSIQYPTYRHEGNGFLVVMNDNNVEFANNLTEKLKPIFHNLVMDLSIEKAFIRTDIFLYTNSITSVADFYYFLFGEYKREFTNKLSEKEIMHYILTEITNRIKESINSYTKVHEFALHDEVSNLPNSKSANIMLRNIKSYYTEYAILFIDGDSLSNFNNISYDEGNNAIRKIGEVISSSIRKSDRVYRWLSGDEFIVVAEKSSIDDVKSLSERIRLNIEEVGMELLFPTTVSIGVSLYPEDGNEVDEILKNAELANKQAKDNGKNRVIYYNEHFYKKQSLVIG